MLGLPPELAEVFDDRQILGRDRLNGGARGTLVELNGT